MGEMIRLETWVVRKAWVVAVLGCVSMIPAAGQEKAQSTARAVAPRKDGRAEIDAHAAEWLKESDVRSVAVAYIEKRRVADRRLWRAESGRASHGEDAVQHGVID